MLNLPTIRRYKKNIKDENWNVIWILRYEQAKLHESFEIEQIIKSDSKLIARFNDFFENSLEIVEEKRNLKHKLPIIGKLYNRVENERKKSLIRDKILWNSTQIYQDVFWHKWDSIFAWLSKEQGSHEPLLSDLMWEVCSFYKISLSDLLEKYTYEQFIWLLDWVTYHYNKQTEKGEQKNQMAIDNLPENKKEREEATEDLNDYFDKFDKMFN